MVPPSFPNSPAELLAAHAGWIRELSRHMVADANVADDLMQEACVTALTHAPRDGSKFRPWLASVMRNALRQKSRGDVRREAREERAARAEAQEATDRLVERVSLERELVQAVLDLDEPYRSVVLLRFFDDLPPREIARRLSVPVNTVHSRLARALKQLRERLDAAHGDRRAWLTLILPLVHKPELLSTAALGGWLLNTKVVIALSAAALLVSTLAVVTLQGDAKRPLEAASHAVEPLAPSRAVDASPAKPEMQREAQGDARTSAVPTRKANEDHASAPLAPSAATAYVVRGRVLDEHGLGRAGIDVEIAGPDEPSGSAAKPKGSKAAGDAHATAGGTDATSGDASTKADKSTSSDGAAREAGAGADRSNGATSPSDDVSKNAGEGSPASLDGSPSPDDSAPGAAVKSLRSGAGGHFEFSTSAASGHLHATGTQWVTVREGTYRSGSALESVLVVAPAIEVAGRTVDASGRPLENVRVKVRLPRGFEARFGEILEASYPLAWGTRVDASGAFTLGRVPSIEGASVVAMCEGYEPEIVELPLAGTHDLEIVLQRPQAPLAGVLRGQVVDAAGAPVAGARVGGGLTSVLTDAEGRFSLDLARAVTCSSLTAVKAGFLPATFDRPESPRASGTTHTGATPHRDDASSERIEGSPNGDVAAQNAGASQHSADDTGWPDFILLRMTGSPLSIQGRVVDQERRPLPGRRVWLSDPTPFGVIGRVPFQIEGLLSGASVPPDAVESEPRAGQKDGDNFNDQWQGVGPASAFWYWTATDEDGRFEFPGLTDREYRLEIMDNASLSKFTSDPIRAGSKTVEIKMPVPKMHAKFVGIVTSDGDEPLEGVRVTLGCAPYKARARVFGGVSEFVMTQNRESKKTDAAGRFEFENVPPTGVAFLFQQEGIVPYYHVLEAKDDPAKLEIRLHARCNLRVELQEPIHRADAVAVRDGEGEYLDVLVLDQRGTNAFTDVALVEGKSQVVSVSSAARTLLLLKDGKEVARYPIMLSRHEVNVVRP